MLGRARCTGLLPPNSPKTFRSRGLRSARRTRRGPRASRCLVRARGTCDCHRQLAPALMTPKRKRSFAIQPCPMLVRRTDQCRRPHPLLFSRRSNLGRVTQLQIAADNRDRECRAATPHDLPREPLSGDPKSKRLSPQDESRLAAFGLRHFVMSGGLSADSGMGSSLTDSFWTLTTELLFVLPTNSADQCLSEPPRRPTRSCFLRCHPCGARTKSICARNLQRP